VLGRAGSEKSGVLKGGGIESPGPHKLCCPLIKKPGIKESKSRRIKGNEGGAEQGAGGIGLIFDTFG